MLDSTYSTSSYVASIFYDDGITTVGCCTLVIGGIVATGGVLYYTGLGTKIYVGVVGLFSSSKGNGSGDSDNIGSSVDLTGVSSDSNLNSIVSIGSNLSSGSDVATPIDIAITSIVIPLCTVMKTISTSTNIEIFKEAHEYVLFHLEKFIQKGFERGYNKSMTSEDLKEIKDLMLRAPEPLCRTYSPEQLPDYLRELLDV